MRYFNFNPIAINLNHKSPEMEGRICPTDTRFRNDQRFFEEGKENEANVEKKILENM